MTLAERWRDFLAYIRRRVIVKPPPPSPGPAPTVTETVADGDGTVLRDSKGRALGRPGDTHR